MAACRRRRSGPPAAAGKDIEARPSWANLRLHLRWTRLDMARRRRRSSGEAGQGLAVEPVLPAAELAGDQRLALGLQGGELFGRHGAQDLGNPLAGTAAAGMD